MVRRTLFTLTAVVLLAGCGPSRLTDSPSAKIPAAGETPATTAGAPPAGETSDATSAAPPVAAGVDFDTQVRPIFEARCQPCHFAGGKMYERLPFDSAQTIRNLGEKLFTRINDPGEQTLIRAFLAQPAAEEPDDPLTDRCEAPRASAGLH